MNYGKIIYYDIANGIGFRTSLFVSGCRHHCKGCFNEVTWDFNYGKPYTKEVQQNILESLNNPRIDGLTILGGEPFEPENQKDILYLILNIRNELPEKTIWIYSGYLWEELIHSNNKPFPRTVYTDAILSNIDILVDGEFELDKKDISLDYRGSSNQRIIDVPKSVEKLHHVRMSSFDEDMKPVLSDMINQ